MAEEEFVARNCVYGGMIADDKGKLHVKIAPVVDGALGAWGYYPHSKKRERIIGAVYSGASFTEDKARGLDALSYEGPWHDREAVLKLRVAEDMLRTKQQSEKLEKAEAKVDELARLLLPLRRQYESFRDRYDTASMAAFDSVVLTALHKKVRPEEK